MNAAVSAAAIPTRDVKVGDGIHVMWTPPSTAGYSIDGWDVLRRRASGRPKVQCRQLTSSELAVLHRDLRLRLTFGELRIRQVPCPEPPEERLDHSVARSAISTTPGRRCAAYELCLTKRHRYVQVRIGVPSGLAIALRGGKAVDARQLTDASGSQTARFEDLDVDRVEIHCDQRAASLEVCLDAASEPGADEAAWASATTVARGLQLPLRSVNPAVGSAAQEDALAKSRLLPGDAFDADAFRDVADLMNAAAGVGMPAMQSTVIRDEPDEPFIDVRTWPYAMALLVHPAWRRMLAFAVLDPAAGLTPAQAYDYRITGRFRRRDVEERVHGFHAVPRGTLLPTTFLLGDIALRTPEPATVELYPQPAPDSLTAMGRKAIRLTGDPCLTISFCIPVSRVVLDVDPSSTFHYTAQTTAFLPGLVTHGFSGSLPAKPRVTVEFADPIDTLVLAGEGLLYAVRSVGSAAGTSPDDIVEQHVVVHGVVFADTPPLPPPTALITANLQQPILPGAASPPAALGFGLAWHPPPVSGGSPQMPWPPNTTSPPPTDAFGFQLERRRVDTGDAFGPLDPEVGPTTIFPTRDAGPGPSALWPGIDLEAVFPEAAPAALPIGTQVTYDDPLVTARAPGPPPGSRHQYRIFTMDALGRPSATSTEGPVVRLEKRQPPPQPVGPPAPSPNDVGTGLRARVLQDIDPDLSDADRTLLGSSSNAVVIDWGWTESERGADPHAREFRVYWQPLTPDVVSGRATGPATYNGGAYEISADFDRALSADALRGRYLSLPDFPFKVMSNQAGQSITLRLEPSPTEPQRIPGSADVTFRPRLDGSELRPPAWAERTAVVPITAAEAYQFVFRDRLTLDADRPRVRVWVGVSAADAQPYVDDSLPPATNNGGRSGNESAIVAAEATARYLGRPEFTVPPPLSVVPEQVTDEPAGQSVTIRLDLPALLPSVPAGSMYTLDRLNLDDVLGCIGVNADDTVLAAFPDGSQTDYALANPVDHQDMLDQIRTSTPALVENRFVMDFVLRFAGALETLWAPAVSAPFAFGPVTDALPAKAARYLHRIRLVDAAGHVSAGGAIAPQVVRTVSLRSPAPPQLTVHHIDGLLAAQVRIRDAADVTWVLLFVSESGNDDGTGAQLLRLPNARDRLPDDGIRLRLSDGTLLAPTVSLNAQGGEEDPPDRVLRTPLPASADRQVRLWGVTVTRDGISSRCAGPLIATAPPAVLVAPPVTVTRDNGVDAVQWSATPTPTLLAIERSLDGGGTWLQVSPWLASGVTSYSVRASAGQAHYRSTVRADRGRRATGAEAVVV